MPPALEIRSPRSTAERAWVEQLLFVRPAPSDGPLPGVDPRDPRIELRVAHCASTPVGGAAFRLDEGTCDLLALSALDATDEVTRGHVLGAVEAEARACGRGRIRREAGNDDLEALAFYQRHGFRVIAVRPAAPHLAGAETDDLGPLGLHDIPRSDVLSLEKRLARGSPFDLHPLW